MPPRISRGLAWPQGQAAKAIASQKHPLEEHHAGRPHIGRPAKVDKEELTSDDLDIEKKQRS
jgi:hypothetical protein